MIVYRMTKMFADREDTRLPTTEFDAQFNKHGWTPEGTMGSQAFASFEELGLHMNTQFHDFVDDAVAARWTLNNPDTPYPLALFMESGWVIEWSDPDFRPLDQYDDVDARSSSEKLRELL